jgi:hypothetical protein
MHCAQLKFKPKKLSKYTNLKKNWKPKKFTLFYATLYYITQLYATLRYAILRYPTLYYATPS